MPYILRKMQHYPPRFLIVQKILSAGHAMSHRLYRGYKISFHNARLLFAVCKYRKHPPVFTEPALQKLKGRFCYIANGIDPAARKFSLSRAPHVQKLASRKRPNLFFIIFTADLCGCIGFFHIAAKFCEHFVV